MNVFKGPQSTVISGVLAGGRDLLAGCPLALGERSGVSPGPGPSSIHKSAAAASGPRGICSSSARDAPLSWRRPRNEPRSALEQRGD